MSNFTLKLDLSKLEGFGEVALNNSKGQTVDCIVIPKAENHIFCSDKGGRYLDLVCFETPNSEFGSHMVTVSKTREETEQEKTTGEKIRKPIVGNLKPFSTGSNTVEPAQTYSVPNASAPQRPQYPENPMPAQPKATQKHEKDDLLPF